MAKEGLGLEITELRLGLPGGEPTTCVVVDKKTNNNDDDEKKKNKRAFSEIDRDDRKMMTKNQVVGWPPVCSYRKKKNNSINDESSKIMYVKVSVDGAPFLRKIDLALHKSYSQLAFALDNLFASYGIGDAVKGEHVPIYEDRDGDWMLVGDVPWQMFIETCKRLRIMKRSDAKGFGLQPKGCLKGFIVKSEKLKMKQRL